MQFSKFDLAKFPYCSKSSYGRLLSREPTNPCKWRLNEIKSQSMERDVSFLVNRAVSLVPLVLLLLL